VPRRVQASLPAGHRRPRQRVDAVRLPLIANRPVHVSRPRRPCSAVSGQNIAVVKADAKYAGLTGAA
jgi:hypothetical protein